MAYTFEQLAGIEQTGFANSDDKDLFGRFVMLSALTNETVQQAIKMRRADVNVMKKLGYIYNPDEVEKEAFEVVDAIWNKRLDITVDLSEDIEEEIAQDTELQEAITRKASFEARHKSGRGMHNSEETVQASEGYRDDIRARRLSIIASFIAAKVAEVNPPSSDELEQLKPTA